MAYDPEAQQAQPKPAQAPKRKIQDDAGPVSPQKATVESAKSFATDNDKHALEVALAAGAAFAAERKINPDAQLSGIKSVAKA